MHGTVPCTDARIVSSTVLADSSRNCESSEGLVMVMVVKYTKHSPDSEMFYLVYLLPRQSTLSSQKKSICFMS